ncbi:hypothetical protein IP92_01276 [Pseudoduganella flava]|uniref:Uncharacterized protein n=1 Tax=Pseudoduganella flava TaxID=871742 RepID=A0A562Q033_9BURK|nr:hypothetical protein [Pseudoduganella flava]TWI50052.1 hypothetical protein IP92_01276 [Pseudoduganella flava]
MLADLLLNIAGPLAAKRYRLVRAGIWLALAVGVAWLAYAAA